MLNIFRTVYHASASFIGNMAMKILKIVDSLKEKLRRSLSVEMIKLADLYIQAFKQFHELVKICFDQTPHRDVLGPPKIS